MTTFLLVRHGTVNAIGRYLAGRAPNEHLNDVGRAQVEGMAERFAGVTIDAIFTSPLERARETAGALLQCAGGTLVSADELLELDFGEWTGKTFDELSADPRWARFNTHRTTTRIPGGELIVEVQNRTVRFIQRLADERPDGRVMLVTHGDVIRSAICFYLGLPLDQMQRFEVDCASVSVLELRAGVPILRSIGDRWFEPRHFFGDQAT
jgi:broad specificity phosphatase PhoE